VTLTGSVVTRETITDESGHYEFCNLMPGHYTVSEILKDGWVNTTAKSVNVVLPTELDEDHFQVVVDFGNFQLGKVTGSKWDDVNADGILDNGDLPIEGWMIILVGPHGTEITFTDEFGNFEFTGLGPGLYDISEELVAGWVHMSPSTETVTVVSGSSLSVPAFLNTKLGEICVFKFEDKNCNGVFDDGEPGVADWPFELWMDDTLIAVGATDSDGFLCFENVMPGDYTVVEVAKEGWTHTTPSEIPVELESGGEVTASFGNFHNVKIVVFKFDDVDGNGIYDPAIDRPLAGWNFTLYEEVGEFEIEIAKGTTDADGIVVFEVTCSGDYEVEEESRLNWVHTVPLSGEYEFEVVSGMEPLFLEFGNFKFGKILGQKIDDLNGNGIRDPGEPGLAGWTIWLAKEGIGPIAFTVTNETGFYEFGGLVPGEYTVYEILQPGWRSTNGESHDVLVLGDSRNIVDFLNTGLACIFGSKYEDVNGDGIFEQGIDIPIEGWKITLEITTGIIHTPEGDISAIAIVGVTYTDEDGQFEFCDLQPGLYIIVEEARDDWVNTTPRIQEVELTGGDIILPPFLNARLGEICAFKFNDLNGNGRWDEGEPGIEGWPVDLWMNDKLVGTGFTCENGFVCFDDLMPGHYTLIEGAREGWTNTTPREVEVTLVSGQEVNVRFGNFHIVCIEIFKYEDMNGNGKYDNGDEPLAGWLFVITGPEFPNGLEVLTNDDGLIHICLTKAGVYTIVEESPEGWVHVNPADGIATIDIKSGDILPVIEFGNMRLGEIIITKFFDMDLDEIHDGDEVGLGGFVFWINGTLNGGGYLNITGITGSNGVVEVTGLPPGTYVVTEKLALSPPGYTPTTPLIRVVDIGSGSVASLEFGNAIVGKITGEKFYDKDLDGILDDHEPGLPGWTIVLTGTTDNGIPVLRTTITDELGMYEFDDVVPGVYEITEILMDDWMHTTTLPVVVDLSGATVIDVVVNIGNIRFAEIHGYKFLDRYGNGPFGGPNGVFDLGESGLGNWQITLVGRTATGVHVSLSVLTDNDDNVGFYEFDDLMPGMYWLNETLLFGYMATTSISHLLIIPSQPLGPFVFSINFGNTIPAPDPQVQFQLHKGWNLWSTPIVVKGLTAKSLLAAIGANGVVISKLVPGQGGYKSYIAGVMPDAYDYPVVLGEGYYIWVKDTTVFSLKGDLSLSSTKALVSGWNLIGYDRMEETSASQLLASVTGGHATAITCIDGNTGLYKSYALGFPSSYDFAVTPGRAYFVWVSGAGTLAF
jgi:protocatechuate 3,4-dioxygenase beta subunit